MYLTQDMVGVGMRGAGARGALREPSGDSGQQQEKRVSHSSLDEQVSA